MLLSACKKEEVVIFEPGDKATGCVTALKNGKSFSASSHLKILGEEDNELGISFTTYDEEGVLREFFGILVPLKVGLYTTTDFKENERMIISAHAGYYDETDIVYEMDGGKDNYVDIQYLNLTTMEAEGTFEIFLKKKGSSSGNYPSKVSMKDGHFEGTIFP